MRTESDNARILIADADNLFREGLRGLLEEQPGLSVVAEAQDGEEALRLIGQLKPDILLLNMGMPKLSGLEVLRSIQIGGDSIRIILMAADIKKEQATEAFRLGAHGLILKESPAALLFKCIQVVKSGQYWLPGKGVSDIPPSHEKDMTLSDGNAPSKRYSLTKREMEILLAVVAGRNNREIAKRLTISEQTVKHHVTNIFNKVGVYNRLELALFAIHHGLIARK
jgi:two-component system, NarL family, nitrate/nitrite response regulator NarL